MTKTRTFAVALSLSAAVACSEQGPIPTTPAGPSSLEGANAKPGGPPPADVAVTSTLGAGDIASDGVNGGAYTNSTTDKSIIQSSNGVWYLGSAPRTVFLRFDGTVTGNGIANTGPNSGPPLNLGAANYQVLMYTACNFPPYGSVSLLTMQVSNTLVPCPMAVQFATGGKQYLLRMNENLDGDTEVDDVNITHPTSTTWHIEPSAGVSNRARLFLQGKGNAGLVPQGDYNMSFSIDVANP